MVAKRMTQGTARKGKVALASKKQRAASRSRATSKRATAKGKAALRAYEGASKSKRLSRWKTSSTSANAEIRAGLVTLRDRSRDLRRNNAYAQKGISVISSNVVGHGISTQFRGGSAPKLEAAWKSWAESLLIDFDGRNNIYGLQKLMIEAVVESGEVLVRKRYDASLEIPLQYQILEADFLDTTKNEVLADGQIIQGIEFDRQGRRRAYWLYETHPGSYEGLGIVGSPNSNRVPKEELYHLYRMDRPGQARGVPWLACTMIKLKDLDDWEDAALVRQKTAACFTAFVRDINPDFSDPEDDDDQIELSERLEPGLIEHLPTGKQIEFSNPPAVTDPEFVKSHLRAVAAGLGITLEALTGDYSTINFSSGRLGWIEMGRNLLSWREHIMVQHGLNPIATDFLTIMALKGVSGKDTTFVHVPPKREMIDPTKEIPAIGEALRLGLSCLSDELMAQGKDPAEFFKQYAADLKMLDENKIEGLESDPRTAVKAAQVKAEQAAKAKDKGESKDGKKKD